MTKLNNENLEELSVVEVKDLIKDSSKESGKTLPPGMWKMNKAQLIVELKNIADSESEIVETELVKESNEENVEKVEIKDEVKELVKDLVEEIVEEKVEEIVEEKVEKVVDKPKRNTRSGKLIYLTLPTGEEIEIQGMGRYHQYFKDNYPELKSWSILGAAVRGEDNEKTKLFADKGFKVRLGEGFQYGHKNQYVK